MMLKFRRVPGSGACGHATCRALLALILFMLVVRPVSADFYDGLRAYDSGRYGEAATAWIQAGDPRSLRRLAAMYEAGTGVVQNFVYAHALYNLAAAGGDDEAGRERDRLARSMTVSDISRAQALALVGPSFLSGRAAGAAGATGAASGPAGAAMASRPDGTWNWQMTLPNSPCDTIQTEPLVVDDGAVTAHFHHPAAGYFRVFGSVKPDGTVSMYAAGDHLQFTFTGRLEGKTGGGTTEGTGEIECSGTWQARKQDGDG